MSITGAPSWTDGAIGVDVYGYQGVSVGDIDGDGGDDLYASQPSGLPNRLFRNDGGLSLVDVTADAGVGVLDSTSMSLFADADNDGDQDLVVITALAPLLFRNDGKGVFRNEPGAFEFSAEPQGQLTSAAMADYDLDGDLDLLCLCLSLSRRDPVLAMLPLPITMPLTAPPTFCCATAATEPSRT